MVRFAAAEGRLHGPAQVNIIDETQDVAPTAEVVELPGCLFVWFWRLQLQSLRTIVPCETCFCTCEAMLRRMAGHSRMISSSLDLREGLTSHLQ